jgi:hypothetical protein
MRKMNTLIRMLKRSAVMFLAGTMAACGGSGSEPTNAEKVSGNSAMETLVNDDIPPPVTMEMLDHARAEGKAVFLVITGTGAGNIGNAAAIANDAHAMAPNSEVFLVNKDDAANGDLVAKFGMAHIPLPFLLVVSPKGNALINSQI